MITRINPVLDRMTPAEKRQLLGELLVDVIAEAVAPPELPAELVESMAADITPAVFNAEDAARYVGIGVNAMRELLDDVVIPARRSGKRWIVRREALDAYMVAEERRQAREKNAGAA